MITERKGQAMIAETEALRARLAKAEMDSRSYQAMATGAIHRMDNAQAEVARLTDQLATARRGALQSIVNMKPTQEQLSSAALSYDHSFGLMNAEDQQTLVYQAEFWLNAWQHEIRALIAQEEPTT